MQRDYKDKYVRANTWSVQQAIKLKRSYLGIAVGAACSFLLFVLLIFGFRTAHWDARAIALMTIVFAPMIALPAVGLFVALRQPVSITLTDTDSVIVGLAKKAIDTESIAISMVKTSKKVFWIAASVMTVYYSVFFFVSGIRTGIWFFTLLLYCIFVFITAILPSMVLDLSFGQYKISFCYYKKKYTLRYLGFWNTKETIRLQNSLIVESKALIDH